MSWLEFITTKGNTTRYAVPRCWAPSIIYLYVLSTPSPTGLCLDVRGYCSRRFHAQSFGHVFQVLMKLYDQKTSFPLARLVGAVATGSQATAMEIHTLEALSDNYMYLIVDASTRAGAVVDPADPDVVMEAVQRLGVTLTHVLTNADMYVPRPPYCTYAARVPVSYV